jgi:diguanylate cyclase (GGDEF)-like protein
MTSDRDARFRHVLAGLLGESLKSGLDEGFYQRVTAGAVAVVPGAEAGSLLVRIGGEFRYVAAVGYDMELLKGVSFAPEEMYLAPTEKAPRVVTSLGNEALDDQRRTLLFEAGPTREIRAALVVPVGFDDEHRVILTLDNFLDPSHFTEQSHQVAFIFAQQIAGLIYRFELERELEQERLLSERLAKYDSLTNLPNRSFLMAHLESLAGRDRQAGSRPALLFLDIDGLKSINDQYGQEFGDAVLRAAGERFAGELRRSDTLARWGGDEFAILRERVTSDDEARALARKVLRSLAEPLVVLGQTVSVTVSVGIAVLSDASTADDFVSNADMALEAAKYAGKNTFSLYVPAMKRGTRERQALAEELRRALVDEGLGLCFQPRVDLRSGTIGSVEALARWHHRDKGEIPPDRFIPLSQSIGLIHDIGRQVLHKACRQIRAWQRIGLPIRVAVNLSPEQLMRDDIVAEIRQALEGNEIEGRWLELEITESTAMADVEGSIRKLTELRALGVQVAIDDFGTGYSSLAYLNRLPIDSLKIDRSFVAGLPEAGKNEYLVVRSIIALGHSLGLNVIGEGVETEEQRECLFDLECDEAQGYFLGPPQPAEKVTKRLLEAPKALTD